MFEKLSFVLQEEAPASAEPSGLRNFTYKVRKPEENLWSVVNIMSHYRDVGMIIYPCFYFFYSKVIKKMICLIQLKSVI